jgi:hypothetical protein
MSFKVKVPGKTVGKLFPGALWKLNGQMWEILNASPEGVVECEDEKGTKIELTLSDLAKGNFMGDKYESEDPDSCIE